AAGRDERLRPDRTRDRPARALDHFCTIQLGDIMNRRTAAFTRFVGFEAGSWLSAVTMIARAPGGKPCAVSARSSWSTSGPVSAQPAKGVKSTYESVRWSLPAPVPL